MADQAAVQSHEPTGYCVCGCGSLTSIAKRNDHARGIKKGDRMRYAQGHGGRAKTKLAADPAARFWRKVNKTPRGCWIWTGKRNEDGYGSFVIGSRTDKSVRHLGAHRFSYEMVHGPASSELHLDHLCRVRHCVNPDHLELVKPVVNILRGVGVAAVNAAKTHCPSGHPYTPENTRIYTRPGANRPGRYCRKCAAIHSASRDRRRRNG